MSTQTAHQTDIRLYRVVHEMFRRSTTRLVDATARLAPSTLQPALGPQWDFYAAILDHHHRTEDECIFPALVAVRPEMRSTIDMLEDEHVELAPNIEAVESAVATFVKRPDTSSQVAVHVIGSCPTWTSRMRRSCLRSLNRFRQSNGVNSTRQP
jgi:hypothetical protein